MMKRGRDEDGISSIEDSSEVAESIIQISSRWETQFRESSSAGARVFNCKTCGRTFSSFQALGGHRASHHKKPRLSELEKISEAVAAKVKAKTIHQCSICGIRFGLGQALGGHMRRHRLESKGGVVVAVAVDNDGVSDEQAAKMVPILMRSLSKRIMCMDLNLTPLENDLQVLFGKKAPRVDCKLV